MGFGALRCGDETCKGTFLFCQVTLGLAMPKQEGREKRESKAERGLCLALPYFILSAIVVCGALWYDSSHIFFPPGSSLDLQHQLNPNSLCKFCQHYRQKSYSHYRVQQLDNVEDQDALLELCICSWTMDLLFLKLHKPMENGRPFWDVGMKNL